MCVRVCVCVWHYSIEIRLHPRFLRSKSLGLMMLSWRTIVDRFWIRDLSQAASLCWAVGANPLRSLGTKNCGHDKSSTDP